MGMNFEFFSFKDGSIPLSTDIQDGVDVAQGFAAGQPVAVVPASGTRTAGIALAVANPDTGAVSGYVGVAKTSRSIMKKEGVASYIYGASKVEFFDNSDNIADDGSPLESGVNFAIGDYLYISVNGKWTNQAPGADATPKGIVTNVVNSDYNLYGKAKIEAILFAVS